MVEVMEVLEGWGVHRIFRPILVHQHRLGCLGDIVNGLGVGMMVRDEKIQSQCQEVEPAPWFWWPRPWR